MKPLFSTFLIATVLIFPSYQTAPGKSSVHLTAEELKLYNLIMAYRAENKLPSIPLSASLTTVAHLHAKDLEENRPDTSPCNMHSWSNKGKWQSCCYTPDHVQKRCMWDKPRELTSYTGNGYEIAVSTTDTLDAFNALRLWKSSAAHNSVITNAGGFTSLKWNAIGIGIYKHYAIVWFGSEVDPAGAPGRPK